MSFFLSDSLSRLRWIFLFKFLLPARGPISSLLHVRYQWLWKSPSEYTQISIVLCIVGGNCHLTWDWFDSSLSFFFSTLLYNVYLFVIFFTDIILKYKKLISGNLIIDSTFLMDSCFFPQNSALIYLREVPTYDFLVMVQHTMI